MSCDDCREQLSARLDGEDDPTQRAAVDSHLETCPECQRWFDGAARVTRLARTEVARPTPDLVAAVLAAPPRPAMARLRVLLRALLAVIGIGQIVLSAVAFLGAGGPTEGGQLGGANLTHHAHEFAAWNLALGVGFLWLAIRIGKAAGLVPTLAVFVVVLTGLEIVDVLRGHVDPLRVLAHALVQAGFVVVLVLMARRLGGGGYAPRWWRERAAAAPVVTALQDRGDVFGPEEHRKAG